MGLRIAVAVLLTVASAPVVLAQQRDLSQVVVQSQKLAEGVYMLTGAGGNIGASVGEDGVIIIDDQFEELTPRIKDALAQLSPKPVRFVINTHWHFDHTGGNENFGRAGSIIVAHDNVRRRMSEKQFMQVINREIPASPPIALPVVTFASDVTLHLNGEEIYVVHVEAAHTDGDSLVLFRKGNVLHAGDTVVSGRYPFIDVASGGTVDGLIACADRVLAMTNADTKIIPGHGPLTSPTEVRAYRDMVATVRERIATQLRAGKTLEEVLAAAPTKDFDAVYGKGNYKAEELVKMVYMDLQKKVK